MFHVQIRDRGQVARAFNLSEPELRAQLIAPILAGGEFKYADQEWDAAQTRVTILDGRELRGNELMLGRGWSNAQKVGVDVTEEFLRRAAAPVDRLPAVDRLKERVMGRLVAGPATLGEVLVMVDDLMAGHRVSERLAVAELASWELLHEGTAQLEVAEGAEPAAKQAWEQLLLSADSWFDGRRQVRLARTRS